VKEVVSITWASGGIGQASLEGLLTYYRVRVLLRKKTTLRNTWQQRGCAPVVGDDDALWELGSPRRVLNGGR